MTIGVTSGMLPPPIKNQATFHPDFYAYGITKSQASSSIENFEPTILTYFKGCIVNTQKSVSLFVCLSICVCHVWGES